MTRSTTLWTRWAGVAVEALRRSQAARQSRLQSENWYPHLRYEMEDGLVAVTGSVFAMEAITRQLAHVDDIVYPQTRGRWTERKEGAAWRTREVLKRCVRYGEGQALGDQWKSLIDRRNEVMHFVAEQRPTVSLRRDERRGGGRAVHATKAAEAVDLLFVTLERLGTRSKPAAQGLAPDFAGQLEELRERRRVGGVPIS